MIGQERLKQRLSTYEWETFPSAVLFIGAFGCGKHTLCNEVSIQLNVPLTDISSLITDDFIMSCYTNPLPKLYLIDIPKLRSSKNVVLVQNTILKFIEEPPQNAKIILLCEHRNQVLPTICNRCQIYVFDRYTIDELKQITSVTLEDDWYYIIYDTPGKLLSLTSLSSVNELKELIHNIIFNIHKASIPNILTIPNKIDWGDGKGYNLQVFIALMDYALLDLIMTMPDVKIYIEYYKLTKKLSEQLLVLHVDTRLLFENYLLNLKGVK